MQTSEVLNRAADLIEERGWTRLAGWNKGDGAPLCLEGGIQAAIGGQDDEYHKGVHGGIYDCPAYWAVQNYLGLAATPSTGIVPLRGTELWNFNDEPGRTANEVIEVLRAAALVEAAREQDREPAEATR